MAVGALLYAGRDAVLSHVTAARLLGIEVPGATDEVWVTVPATKRLRRRPGLVLKRTRMLPRPVIVSGKPVTSMARTIVDLAQVLDRNRLLSVIHDVARTRPIDIPGIWAAAESLRGRAGLGLLREVLDEFDADSESVLEDEAARLLARSGLRLDRQVEVFDGSRLVARLDFADRARRLAVEVDGLRYHSDYRAMNRDRQRDRALLRLGWTVTRFTADDVRRHPERMIKEIRELLAKTDRRAG
jgi:very-short-patch-repair endonuclease